MRNSLLTVLLLAAIGAGLFALGGCRDYEGEARLAADAQVQSARIAADADIQTTSIEQTEATKRNTAWVSVLPFLLGIVAVAGVVWLAVWFRGKKELLVTQALLGVPEFVQAEAARRGLLPVRGAGDSWLLVDGERKPRVRLIAARE